MPQGFNTTNRPGQDAYQTAFDNKGKYGSAKGRPYINPSVPMYVPQVGENCIRVVDPIELAEMGTYFFDVYFHRDVGYKNDYFMCDKEHGRGPCPSCAMVTPDVWEQDKDLAKDLLPDMRRLLWVIDLQKPQEINVLKLWSCPRTLSDEILTQSRRPDQNVFVDIAHPETGVPVFFNRAGQGKLTKYTGVQLGQQPYPIGEEIAYQRFEFNDILMWHEYEEFAEALNQTPEDGGTPDNASGVPDGYNQAPTTPAEEIGAAAARNTEPANPNNTEPEIDYSDLKRIQPDNKDCFRNNFNEYEECDSCPDRTLCEQPWPTIQKKSPKPSKPSAPGKTAKPKTPETPSGPSSPSSPSRPTSPAGPGGANKIADAQARLRAEIEARKAGK